MATNEKIKSDIQKLDIGSDLIELYTIDATSLGGDIFRFTPMAEDGGSSVVFNGVTYLPLPVEFTGMEIQGDGNLPRPRMKVANVGLTFVGLIAAYNDGLGATVTRIRTFSKYIDGHAEEDSSAQFPQDIFYIEHLLEQNKYFVEWELVCPLDIGDKKIPRNQVISYCQHSYRVYREGAFFTEKATCPYAGTDYFTSAGVVTTIANDVCGKKLSDCKLRYSSYSDQLPFFGFPGVGQLGRAYR